jgi:hypothetical protein
MDFRTFYIRNAVDKVNEAESQLHVEDSIEEIIAVVNKIKRARAELRRRKAETFKDEHDFAKHYEDALDDIVDGIHSTDDTNMLLQLCNKLGDANVRLYKAHALVSMWKTLL